MNKEIAIEIATKYANDIWLFGEVNKECVSKVCKTLLSELDIANKKLKKIKELVNKYGYYTLSEIPELLSIIDINNKEKLDSSEEE